MERLLDEVSFDAPDRSGTSVTIDEAYVDRMLAEIVANDDLSRYILVQPQPLPVTPRTSRPIPIRPIAYACVLAALVTTACGKKGPPLAPFAKAPAAPAEATARRLGNRVEIRFTVPTVDLDGQRPAHIDRVEVWALTGQVPDPILFMKYATLVGTVPVRRPPPPPPDVEEGKPPPPPRRHRPSRGSIRASPGSSSTSSRPTRWCPSSCRRSKKQKARDEELRLKRLAEQEPPRLTPPDLGTPLPPPLMRYYVVIGRNGGRKGALTQRLAVALRPAPPAPPQPTSTLAENYVELTWTAPPGLPKPVHKGTALAPAARPGRRLRGAPPRWCAAGAWVDAAAGPDRRRRRCARRRSRRHPRPLRRLPRRRDATGGAGRSSACWRPPRRARLPSGGGRCQARRRHRRC